MESVGMNQFGDIYRGRRVLVTGHTGFKGSWLAAWLCELGAQVTGFALPPATAPNHWDLLRLPVGDLRGDIRDAASVHDVVSVSRPEIVFHLSAQPLVRRSYRDPLETWTTNVMGTATLLDACRNTETLRAVVVVTSDKVYANSGPPRAYTEGDRLGGHDPYSASKAACELVVESYRNSFFFSETAPLMATARAGNVIGGGDWSEDRLIPDVIRALEQKESVEIRSPEATRPWQHVLECLGGYLMLGQQLLLGRRDFAQAWNFGPTSDDNRTVSSVLSAMQDYWPELRWRSSDTHTHLHEAKMLHLDSSRARSFLGWKTVWDLGTALKVTADWYREYGITRKPITNEQIAAYVGTAVRSGCAWAA